MNEMFEDAYQLVKQFQQIAQQPVSCEPKKLDLDRVRIRAKWMQEELDEFCTADSIYSQADALTDLLYYLMGAFVEMGIEPSCLFRVVHSANMRKLQNQSAVIKDADGKVLKPEMWEHPDSEIEHVINRHVISEEE